MIYGGEQLIQYPIKDLFDKQLMAMSINAAKDMYEKGQQLIKDFYDKYGDFTSPILKDMDWYNLNVTGKARDVINNLYANGIDPLRSAEGRAAVQLLIYSMPTGDIAKVRLSAETAKEYLKSFDDNTNPELERFLGRDLSSWSTLGDPNNGVVGNGVWGYNKASKYLDLNAYTNHVFDNIKDSYIGTDKNHYDWFGVTENDLYKSLTPDTLGGLLNTDLGRFHYLNAIRDLAVQGVANPTEQQKMEQFRRNIVAANHERIHQDRKLNELWKMRQENAARRSGSQPTTRSSQWSWMEALRRNTAAHAANKTMQDWGVDGKSILNTQRDVLIDFGKKVSKATNGNSGSGKGGKMFVDQYEKVQYNPTELIGFLVATNYDIIDGNKVPRWEMINNNTFRIPVEDANRILTRPYVVSHTTGYRGPVNNYKYNFKNADYIDVSLSGGVYGAYTKDSRNENHFRISGITVHKVVGNKKDENGNELLDKNGNTIPDVKSTKLKGSDTMYFDSHITSEQDDPRTGYLDNAKNIPVTNTQDLRYMDAVQGDRVMSGMNVSGTGYDFSATLPEILGFGE